VARTIVVGYDDKGAARRALDYAVEEAKTSRARLVVLAVAEMPLNPQGLQTFGTLDDSPAPSLPLQPPPDLEEALGHARAVIDAAGVRADYVWSAGDPSGEIVGTARDQKAELVVLGAHHHKGLFGFFGADVPEAVEHELGAKVVVVE
jgi:nucleotide-binding universal stress UspA family protein